jgi:hypothetical protein
MMKIPNHERCTLILKLNPFEFGIITFLWTFILWWFCCKSTLLLVTLNPTNKTKDTSIFAWFSVPSIRHHHWLPDPIYWLPLCRNSNLRFATKARACKVAGQKGSLGVTPHAPKSVGMNLHTPKGASTLGIGVPKDFQIFRKKLQGSKLNGLRISLYHWKALRT